MTNWNMRTEELELKDGGTIKNYHYEFNSTDRVLAKIVEDVFKGIMDIKADRKTEPLDKDINVRSKTEPQTCDTCKFELYCPEMCEGCCEWDSHYEPKTEPQTETSTNAEKVQLKVQLTDEPQTGREGE